MSYKTATKIDNKYDYIPGALSPYDNPTIATEMIIYHKTSFQLGLKNDSARSIRPSLRFFGASYDLIPITEKSFVEKMIAGIKPVRLVTIGGLAAFTYTVPEEWKGNEVIVDKEAVERIMTAYGGK
jgi:hypothetical protein